MKPPTIRPLVHMVRRANTSRCVRLAASAALASACTSAYSEILPIINPGFESLNVSLRSGEQTNGAGGGVTPVTTRWQFPFSANGNNPQSGVLVPGWRTLIPLAGQFNYAGVLRPDVVFGNTPWMTGYSGSHIAVAQVSAMQQTLNVQLQPATTYTLRFLAGIGITDSSYSPFIGLVASPDLQTLAFANTPGVTTLATLPLTNIQPGQFGSMLPFSFSYTTPAVLPPNLQGHYIAISFIGSDGLPRMCYDDFQLEAIPSPGAAGLGLICGGLLALRRKR